MKSNKSIEPVGLAPVLVALLLIACARPPKLPGTVRPDASMAVAERPMTLELIEKELWHGEEDRVFRNSTLRERLGVTEILSALLARAESGDADLRALHGKAAAIGFRLEIWRLDDRVFWALLEGEEDRRGAGAYIVRVANRADNGRQVVLQSPHAYYDLGTGVIGTRLFFAPGADARAFFTNTVHRYWDGTGANPARDHSPADVCHRADHVFQYATDAAARVLGNVVVVQLHGFADKPKRPDAIVSAGDINGSTPVVKSLTDSIGDLFGTTQRYPEETDDLGGTTNAQGRMLQNYRNAHFVHLELSRKSRDLLIDSADALHRLGDALRQLSTNADPSEDER